MPAHHTPLRARIGVSLMFFTNGALLCALLPRYPEIKEFYRLTDAAFGLLVVSIPAGAILATMVAPSVIRRFGAPWVAAVGALLMAVAASMATLSPVVAGFAVAMAVAGACDGLVDSAQNVQGVLVEQWQGRSVLNSMHALWSVGAALGGLLGAGAAAIQLPIATQMMINGIVFGALAVLGSVLAHVPAGTVSQPVPAVTEPGTVRPRARWLLAPIIGLAICGILVEDVSNNWVPLYLVRETGAGLALAGAGLSVVLAAQCIGRFAGDPMTNRWGRDRVAALGGVLIALGSVVAMTATHPAVGLLGFGISGFGTATLIPAAFAAAGRIPGLAEATGVAVISWTMRLGFLVASPTVGVLAQVWDLRAGLLVPVLAGLAAAALSLGQVRKSAAQTPARP
ncbi:MFS transporter [Naumannella halotolerans]|uniref:Fucose permease n=1 Tax=Naumannella halotolerans TaxID=993414 RepID=A0A4R7JBA0_9ACTN|nr:MFS transporter [Naumannella halotolerans]TDT33937.1 fucose permease [Naumannella halotolerans]